MTAENIFRDRYGISDAALVEVSAAEKALEDIFKYYDNICEYNTLKVMSAFSRAEVQSRHFSGTTGYGYSDDGKIKLCELFADIFGAEDALVSPHIMSGTHAISTALFGLLRPLDVMLCITGTPYDTLLGVIGINEGKTNGSSLADFAIKYQQIDLLPTGNIDIRTAVDNLRLNKSIKVVYIQRSRGYSTRRTLSVTQISDAIKAIREKNKTVKIVVDNCYGEFCERLEPTEVGADLIIGSLIKNPGAGIAPTGGYIAGKKECVALAAERLSCAGIGSEIGSYAYGYLPYYQGIYFAPTAVRNALKGAALMAYIYEHRGHLVSPRYDDIRSDITQTISFPDEEALLAFMRAVQKASPVDSNAVPYPWDMPGYKDPVVMAAGTFIQGASIELSADAPMRKPYTAYMQGGLLYESVKLALLCALTNEK